MTNKTGFYGLPRTRKLYHEDQYETRCQADVLAVADQYAVFDQSIFYAESGGQVADQGFVDGRRVIDVQKISGRPFVLPNNESLMVDTVFLHEFAEPCDLRVGQTVKMEIDWDRRYENMKMHTLAHFLFHATGEWMNSYGMERVTKGCHISGEGARFDFHGTVPPEAVPAIQDRVVALLDTSGEAEITGLDGTDDVFIWSAGGVTIPCGGTHVRNSAEIVGTPRVRRRSKGKNLTRLYVQLEQTG